jgi:hypothetical protein
VLIRVLVREKQSVRSFWLRGSRVLVCIREIEGAVPERGSCARFKVQRVVWGARPKPWLRDWQSTSCAHSKTRLARMTKSCSSWIDNMLWRQPEPGKSRWPVCTSKQASHDANVSTGLLWLVNRVRRNFSYQRGPKCGPYATASKAWTPLTFTTCDSLGP